MLVLATARLALQPQASSQPTSKCTQQCSTGATPRCGGRLDCGALGLSCHHLRPPHPHTPCPPFRASRLVDLSRRQLLNASLASICACCSPQLLAAAAPRPAAAEQVAGTWGYSCATGGAAAWEGMCKSGAAQSPIDIPLPLQAHQTGLDPIRFGDYPRFLKASIFNTGHGTMQASGCGLESAA